MTSVKRFAILVIAAVTLTGCASRPMNQLASMQPNAAASDNALAQDYAALSKAYKFQGDHRDADTYAQRATAAAGGQPPGPDQVELRRPFLIDKYVSELSDARQRLVSALDKTGRTKAPEDAARAQTSYDCWVEQASEDLQPADINACKQAFMDAIAKVEAALLAEEPAPVPEAAAPEPGELLMRLEGVNFAFDSAKLTPESEAIVDEAVQKLQEAASVTVRVEGHTDSVGSEAYNLDLSERRAQAVVDYLISKGIDPSRVEPEGMGEGHPVDTNDTKEGRYHNRRVDFVVTANQ